MGIIINEDASKSGIISGIENGICQIIILNEMLQNKDLTIIKVNLFDNNEFLLDTNYLLFSKTKEILELENIYNIYNENDESKIQILSEITSSINSKALENYKFKNDILNTLQKFFEHDSRSYI